jgi:hypothetical protein
MCSSFVFIKSIFPFSQQIATGDTPEAVMAQLTPFYQKYDEVITSDVHRYNSWSINYTFIGPSTTNDGMAYYDVKLRAEKCFYMSYRPSKLSPPSITDVCIPFEEVEQIKCTVPTCPAPANGQRAAADCTQTVSLTPVSGQAEPRPNGSESDGKSTYDLIAKVTEGNQPKAGMALTFTVEVEPGSGNHPLNPPDRPKGELSVKSGTTNTSGEVRLTFTSPIFSGTHTVTVTCAKCTGTKKDDIATFTVKVPNLIKTPADINWRFISNDNYHKNNNASTATQTVYYLTQPAYTGLIQLTKYMVNNGWKTNSEKPTSVGLNDASLEWGGKFYSYPGSGSIYPNWTGIKSSGKQYAHVEHRLGVQIDLRTTDASNELEKQMYQKICNPQDGKYPVQAKLLWHTGVQKCTNAKGVLVSCTPEHYHAYLMGDINSSLGGGKCSSTPN